MKPRKATVIIGAQYGGEGKGKIAAYLSHADSPNLLIRPGGPNASHTFTHNGELFTFRMLPCGAVTCAGEILFPAGSLIHAPTLIEEIERIGCAERIHIDSKAGLITPEIIALQRKDPRYESLGSTMTGSGYAASMRCLRELSLVSEDNQIQRYICDSYSWMEESVSDFDEIIIEGCQAYGLSNYHGDYPYVSSRDSTAAAMLSQSGLPPTCVKDVVLVAKCFPTRNHSGSLPSEMTLDEADELGIIEHGGGSYGSNGNRRRTGRFDIGVILRAIFANDPSFIALTGIDLLNRLDIGVRTLGQLSMTSRDFIDDLESKSNVRVGLISTGQDVVDTIDLR